MRSPSQIKADSELLAAKLKLLGIKISLNDKGVYDVPIEAMLGSTLTQVHNNKCEIGFRTDAGHTFLMHHEQDCCESVYVEDICGDLDDLLGTPITMAEEPTGMTAPFDGGVDDDGYRSESYTWTFYKIGTNKGSVTIRWLGQSNGYYSESVSFTVKIDRE